MLRRLGANPPKNDKLYEFGVVFCWIHGGQRMTMFLAMLAKPFILFAMLMAAWPIKRLIEKKMPDGRLKRILLFSWK